ncbi:MULTISPECIES: hypothetical protein [unclassified Cupriavidus]|uniref:hypothetical protein n=2 Tax=Burkholderiaceae TaxID=119060 RepID=UPI001056BDEA|nr:MULTISPECIES: hypothetical protein [unclassified Cupriavidus]MBF6988751.1 hypothetical protein [Cupriavidus sp. IK-TO18]TDF66365.1 hypothetical protein E1J61_11205 [Cupriavidus sp. L7L]
MQKRTSKLWKRYTEPTHVALEIPEGQPMRLAFLLLHVPCIARDPTYTEGATSLLQEVAMTAALITALALIALVACAAFAIWIMREKNPTLLQQQEQSVRTWFDHMIHRH